MSRIKYEIRSDDVVAELKRQSNGKYVYTPSAVRHTLLLCHDLGFSPKDPERFVRCALKPYLEVHGKLPRRFIDASLIRGFRTLLVGCGPDAITCSAPSRALRRSADSMFAHKMAGMMKAAIRYRATVIEHFDDIAEKYVYGTPEEHRAAHLALATAHII